MSKISFPKKLLYTLILFNPLCSYADTCPDIRGIADINCDGKVQITFIGDSIVTGFGDKENRNRGGYVLRLQKRLSDLVFRSVAVNGLKTTGLLKLLIGALEKEKYPKIKQVLNESDVVIFDMGRNDRLIRRTAKDTYKSLQKAAQIILNRVNDISGYTPLVVTSAIMIPKRSNLAPFVKSLNSIILQGDTAEKPSDLRFDKASPNFLSEDKLHPNSKGYEGLSKIAEEYLLKKLPGETNRRKKAE